MYAGLNIPHWPLHSHPVHSHPTHSSWNTFAVAYYCYRTSGEAAWLAIQEAAKHCTAVRMRTHLGNPAQTFAALEQMVQSVLNKLSTTSASHQSDPAAANTPLYAAPATRSSTGGPLLEPSTMLLEFMHTLEKNMYCTYAGSCMRPGVTGSAVAFYKSNRKV